MDDLKEAFSARAISTEQIMRVSGKQLDAGTGSMARAAARVEQEAEARGASSRGTLLSTLIQSRLEEAQELQQLVSTALGSYYIYLYVCMIQEHQQLTAWIKIVALLDAPFYSQSRSPCLAARHVRAPQNHAHVSLVPRAERRTDAPRRTSVSYYMSRTIYYCRWYTRPVLVLEITLTQYLFIVLT